MKTNAEIEAAIEAQARNLQSAILALRRGEKQDVFSCLKLIEITKDNLSDVREALAQKFRT